MCIDPVTLAAVGSTLMGGTGAAAAGGAATLGTMGTIATIAGTGISAYASYSNAKAAEGAARMNARAQDKAALDAIEQGQQESDRQRRAGARLMGEQRVGLAANGIDTGGTAALDILEGTARDIEEDAFTIRENARRGGTNMSLQAANSRAEARTAKSRAFFEPVSNILTSASKVGSRYASYT